MNTNDKKRIEEEAREWSVALSSEDVDKKMIDAFYQWRRENPLHEKTFQKTDRIWQGMAQMEHMRRYATLPEKSPSMLDNVFEQAKQLFDSLMQPQALSAACAVLVITVFVGFWSSQDTQPSDAIAHAQKYSTNRAEVTEFILEDGSMMTLGADSVANVSYSKELRKVTLIKGDGLFNVTSNPSRPFVVITGETETRVLGTVFVVERNGEKVSVAVKEGKVSVGKPAPTNAQQLMYKTEVLLPGQGVQATIDGQVEAVQTVNIDTVGAWTKGRLVYEDAPLKEIVEDINRYYDGNLILGNSVLGDQTLSIAFDIKEINEVIDVIAEVMELKVNRALPGTVVLSAP